MADAGPIAIDALTDLITRILVAAGAIPEEANLVAAHVVDAEARESRSQGLVRVSPYVNWVRSGEIISPTRVTIERDSGAVLVMDSHHGWGHVASFRAMEMCMARARETGVCLSIVRNMNHKGRLGAYVEYAAAGGMIGLIAGSGNPESSWVAPWGGIQPLFGTNPLAIGFPRRSGPPVVVDLSTTQGARGHVLLAQKLGRELASGWAFDAQGRPTTDPQQALPPAGTLAPLGGHKGYALAVAIEILCGVLAGLWPPTPAASLVGAIAVEAILPRDMYEESLERLIAAIKAGPTRPDFDEILLPGEGSNHRLRRSAAGGLHVSLELWEEIKQLASTLKVLHPLLGGDRGTVTRGG
jgi:LDH2 family malate/lactate/ureidoglycolate dehydrogenase